MAEVFKTALAPPKEEPTVFQKILQELSTLDQPAPPRPQYSPEQVDNNIRQNTAQLQLGLMGQMSGDPGMTQVGGQVFKHAFNRNQPEMTPAGTMDELTGQFTPSPQAEETAREARRDRIFKVALASEDARQREKERIAQANANREDQQAHRRDMITLAASLRPTPAGKDPAIVDLQKEILQGKVDAAKAKADEAAAKKKAGVESSAAKAQMIIGKVDEALKDTGRFTTGAVGSVFGRVPGTTAYDLRKTIETVKANIGFEELNAMRQASPTGGALGQVALRELDMLQAVIANLDANQSQATVRRSLQQVRKHFENWKRASIRGLDASEAPAAPPGGSSPPAHVPGATPTPAPGGPPPGVDPRTWQHMTPEEKALFK